MIAIVRGGGQRVMIEIIIRVNDENDGRPLICNKSDFLSYLSGFPLRVSP